MGFRAIVRMCTIFRSYSLKLANFKKMCTIFRTSPCVWPVSSQMCTIFRTYLERSGIWIECPPPRLRRTQPRTKKTIQPPKRAIGQPLTIDNNLNFVYVHPTPRSIREIDRLEHFLAFDSIEESRRKRRTGCHCCTNPIRLHEACS